MSAHNLMRIQLNERQQPTGLYQARFLRALTIDFKYSVDHVELASHLQFLLMASSIRLVACISHIDDVDKITTRRAGFEPLQHAVHLKVTTSPARAKVMPNRH